MNFIKEIYEFKLKFVDKVKLIGLRDKYIKTTWSDSTKIIFNIYLDFFISIYLDFSFVSLNIPILRFRPGTL